MARLFLSRQEWPLIAAGVIAGLVTVAVVLYLFVTGLGGSAGPAPDEIVDARPATADTAVAESETTTDRAASERRGAVIGAREGGILDRMEAMPVRARPLAGPIAITVRDLVWNEASGARFLTADVVRGSLDTRAAQRGDVILSNVTLQRPNVALREDAGGWNYLDVFEELLEGGDGAGPAGRKRTVQVRNVAIVNGHVDVARPEQRFAFHDVQGRLPLVVFSQQNVSAPYLTASTVSGRFVQAEPAADLVIEMSDGLFQFPDGTVRFEVASASLDGTRFAALDGDWDPTQPGYGVTATGRALGVDFADVAFITPEGFPAVGTATFSFAVEPAEPAHTLVTLTDLDAESEGSRVVGSMTARLGVEYFELITAELQLDPMRLALVENFTGNPLPYGGSVAGTVTGTGGDISFDLIASLTADAVPEPFQAGLTGRVQMTEAGFAMRRVDVDLERVPLAALRAFAPAMPLEGLVTGRVSLSGPPGEAPLDVDVRLELGSGVALVAGTLDMTGATPRYDLSGRLLGVDLEAVLAPAVPPVALTARFAVAGTGFDPATMNANITAAGRFTGWRTTESDTLHAVASISGGTLGVDTLIATVATAQLKAAGDWRFLEPQSGAITYQLAVSELDPFGPYLPMLGDSVAAGQLVAQGSVTGTLDRMQLIGTAEGSGLAAGGWQAASLDADYDLLFGGALPEGRLDARVSQLVTPTAGAYEEGELALRITPPTLAFEVVAEREDGGLVEVVASGNVPESGPRTVLIEEARFDLADDQWTLLAPATITWSDEGLVDIDDLVIESANTEGRISLAGRLMPRGRVDAEFDIAAFPMGDVQRLAGLPARVEGLLWASGTVRGGTESPAVDIEFRVDEGALDEIDLQRIEGRLAYLDNETIIAAQIEVDTAGVLNLEATLPSRLSLDEELGFELLDGIPLSGSLTARQFALAPLAAGQTMIRDVTGVINADVTLGGTAENPQVDGAFTLADGAVTVIDMNQRYTEITGQVDFDGRQLVLEDVRARSDGWAVVSGAIVLERLDEPVLDLDIRFDEFRPMGVEGQGDMAVYGNLELNGAPDAMRLTGAITVEDGYVQIPQFGGGLGAELADITRPLEMSTSENAAPQGATFENLRINNLRVAVGDGAWFIADQARAQLTGQLVVNKTASGMPITGTLTGTRGQYTLVAGPLVRRFEVVSSLVRFRGLPEPNPLVEITARRIVLDPDGRQMDVDVLISGTLDEPRLSLAGGEAGMIAESELLSFLLFGQSGFTGAELQPEQGGLLEQTFLGGFAEIAALELERSLGGLGLDVFQIRLGPGALGGLGAPTFVFGRQLRDDVFLTVETGISALFGDEGGGLDTWAMRLDWTFDPRSRLRLAIEPVYRGRSLRGAGLSLGLSPPKQQLLVEVRRRWTY